MWRASSVAAVAIWKHISAASAQRALSAAGAWNPGSGRDWQAPGLGLLPMPGSDHGQSPKTRRASTGRDFVQGLLRWC